DGEMGLGSRPPTRVAIAAWPWGAYLGDEGLKHGVRLKTSSFQRFHPNTLLTKAKAVGHYVNSILAYQEARDAGCDEALLLDVDGDGGEGSGEKVLIAQRGGGGREATRRSCSTSPATWRRRAARTSSSCSRAW